MATNQHADMQERATQSIPPQACHRPAWEALPGDSESGYATHKPGRGTGTEVSFSSLIPTQVWKHFSLRHI